MSNPVPSYVDPYAFAERGNKIEGQVPVTEMARLVPLLSRPDGVCQVELQFGKDLQGIATITGTIHAELVLVCQRCMEAMPYNLDIKVSLGLVNSEAEAERLPKIYDPLEIETDKLFVHDLVEDEIILALPVVSVHTPDQCGVELTRETDEPGTAPKRDNPFAVLAGLKKD